MQRLVGTLRRRAVVGAVVALALFCPPLAPAAQATPYGFTTEFASVPAPGHPFGVLATDNAVYVATSAGAMPGNVNTTGAEAVFRYGPRGGSAEATVRVPTPPTMGLYDVADDAQGRIYVVDMNSRILRFTPTARGLSGPEVYATVPEPFATLGWASSMWSGFAFDQRGNLYVTDQAQGAIWIIPPNSPSKTSPRVWLQCPEFLTVNGAGLIGIAFGPDRNLYFVLATRPIADGSIGESVVYRLPMKSSGPACDELQIFHEFPLQPEARPSPFPVAGSIAFARSGNLYVTLTASNQIAALGPDGHLINTITNSAFDVPIGMRFQGSALLVANSNDFGPADESHWQILKVYVGESGLPLNRPNMSN